MHDYARVYRDLRISTINISIAGVVKSYGTTSWRSTVTEKEKVSSARLVAHKLASKLAPTLIHPKPANFMLEVEKVRANFEPPQSYTEQVP